MSTNSSQTAFHSALYTAVFERAGDAMLLADDAMRFTDANPAACALLGYTRDELRTLTLADITPEEERHRLTESWVTFRGLDHYRIEWRFLAKDGTVRVVDVHSTSNIMPGLHLSIARDKTPRAELTRATNRPSNSRGTILIVEDEDAVREFVRLVLEQAGYTVLAATNGEQALEVYKSNPDRVDLVLSDVMMPNRTGPQLAAELRQLRPNVRVVFMSGFTGGIPTQAPETIAGAPLLDKPFSLDRLLTVVAETIAPDKSRP